MTVFSWLLCKILRLNSSFSSLVTNWEEELETWGFFVVKKYTRKDRDETYR
jgi:hypothetical protein